MENPSNAIHNVHWFVIKVYDKRGGNGTLVEFLKWENMRFDIRLKYDWYFKYRAALLQVKYPKYHVDCYWGNEPAQGNQLVISLKNRITAKKRQLTQCSNKIKLYRLRWHSLFPIDDYQKINDLIDKEQTLKHDLELLQLELDQHSTNGLSF